MENKALATRISDQNLVDLRGFTNFIAVLQDTPAAMPISVPPVYFQYFATSFLLGFNNDFIENSGESAIFG